MSKSLTARQPEPVQAETIATPKPYTIALKHARKHIASIEGYQTADALSMIDTHIKHKTLFSGMGWVGLEAWLNSIFEAMEAKSDLENMVKLESALVQLADCENYHTHVVAA